METLAEIFSLLNRGDPPDESARNVLPLIAARLEVDTCAILVATPDSRAEVLWVYGPTRRRGFPYPGLDLLDADVAPFMHQSNVVSVGSEHRSSVNGSIRAVCHPRFACAFVASIPTGHTVGGLLVMSRRRAEPLTTEQTALVHAIADGIGLALGNAALSRQSHMSEVVLETACAVARAISGSLDVAETFTQIARSAAQVMGDCNCLLLELDAVTDELVAVATSDEADRCLLGLRVRFEGADSNREALRERRSIVVEDLVWGAHTGQVYRDRLHIDSALFVPIHADDLIGSLLLYSTERRGSYSSRDIGRAETVAEQAASAICNARLYRNLESSKQSATSLLERITRLRERQRVEFANVIHDDVVQTVVAALYELESLRHEVPQKALQDLDRVGNLLRRTIADARGVIWELRPPVLEGLGLSGALHALVERASSVGNSEFDVSIEDAGSLPQGVATALYVVAREALQNARKHASANRIVLRVERTDEDGVPAIRLVVVDDGSGFEKSEVSQADHFGLTMMDEHTMLVGGSLTIASAPGCGTSVEVRVPIAPTTQEET